MKLAPLDFPLVTGARRLLALALALALAPLTAFAAAGGTSHTELPWSGGRNDPALDKGYVFQVPGVDNVPDLHGNPAGAELVLFIGGNQFMVLPKLVSAFVAEYPRFSGKIFYETLPPGILIKQMQHGGTLTLGNLTLTVHPDVFEAGKSRLKALARENAVEGYSVYATNILAIMVRTGNPKHIHSLRDLGRDDVRLSMPNPSWEGVARLIRSSLRKAGGDALVKRVMATKVKNGSTYLTHVHHRQTAMRIMEGLSDAGVTWQSEVRFQESLGNPIEGVAIPPRENTTGVYAAGVLRNAPHQAAGRLWVKFLQSGEAQAIYHTFGFGSPQPAAPRMEHARPDHAGA